MLRRQAGEPEDAARHPPAVPQAEFRQRARRQVAFHPDVRAAASGCHLAPGWRLEPVFLRPEEHRDVRAALSVCRPAPGWHPEPVFLEPEGRRDVRAASSGCHLAPAWRLEPVTLQPPGERRGVRAAWRQALASRTVWVWLLGQQVPSSGELPVLRATERALPSAWAVSQGLLKVAWLQQAEVLAG